MLTVRGAKASQAVYTVGEPQAIGGTPAEANLGRVAEAVLLDSGLERSSPVGEAGPELRVRPLSERQPHLGDLLVVMSPGLLEVRSEVQVP